MNKSFALSACLGLMLISSAAVADKSNLVVVSGDCLRSLTPDRGAIVLTAEASDKNPGLAMEKASAQYNQIRERVRKMNLKNMELETTEFTVNEEFDWAQNKKRSLGFKARAGLRVTTSETSKLGNLAVLASDLKLQDVSGLQHFVARETLQKERESCLEEAFQNAKLKAEKLAKVSGQKLGKAAYIREDLVPSAEGPQPRLMARMDAKMEMASANSPVIEAGTSKVSVSVHVGFELN